MKVRNIRFTLDCSKVGKQILLEGIRKHDIESTQFIIKLVNAGITLKAINDTESVIATMYCIKPDGTQIVRPCTINSNGEILYTLKSQDTAVAGIYLYQLRIISSHTNDTLLVSPEFQTIVEESIAPDFLLQTSKPADWEENYNNYYILENGHYIKNNCDATPEWLPNRYYTDITNTNEFEALLDAINKANAYNNRTEEFIEALNYKEDKINKVNTLSSESTNTQYPSAKAVYDAIVESSSVEFVSYDSIHTGGSLNFADNPKRIYNVIFNAPCGPVSEGTKGFLYAPDCNTQILITTEGDIYSREYNITVDIWSNFERKNIRHSDITIEECHYEFDLAGCNDSSKIYHYQYINTVNGNRLTYDGNLGGYVRYLNGSWIVLSTTRHSGLYTVAPNGNVYPVADTEPRENSDSLITSGGVFDALKENKDFINNKTRRRIYFKKRCENWGAPKIYFYNENGGEYDYEPYPFNKAPQMCYEGDDLYSYPIIPNYDHVIFYYGEYKTSDLILPSEGFYRNPIYIQSEIGYDGIWGDFETQKVKLLFQNATNDAGFNTDNYIANIQITLSDDNYYTAEYLGFVNTLDLGMRKQMFMAELPIEKLLTSLIDINFLGENSTKYRTATRLFSICYNLTVLYTDFTNINMFDAGADPYLLDALNKLDLYSVYDRMEKLNHDMFIGKAGYKSITYGLGDFTELNNATDLQSIYSVRFDWSCGDIPNGSTGVLIVPNENTQIVISDTGDVYYRNYNIVNDEWYNFTKKTVLDDKPTQYSENAITSGGVFNALKENKDFVNNKARRRIYFKKRCENWDAPKIYFYNENGGEYDYEPYSFENAPQMTYEGNDLYSYPIIPNYDHIIFFYGDYQTSNLVIPPEGFYHNPIYIQSKIGYDGIWGDFETQKIKLFIQNAHNDAGFNQEHFINKIVISVLGDTDYTSEYLGFVNTFELGMRKQLFLVEIPIDAFICHSSGNFNQKELTINYYNEHNNVITAPTMPSLFSMEELCYNLTVIYADFSNKGFFDGCSDPFLLYALQTLDFYPVYDRIEKFNHDMFIGKAGYKSIYYNFDSFSELNNATDPQSICSVRFDCSCGDIPNGSTGVLIIPNENTQIVVSDTGDVYYRNYNIANDEWNDFAKKTAIDETPTENSTNAVSSGAVYLAINNKANEINGSMDNLIYGTPTRYTFQWERGNIAFSTGNNAAQEENTIVRTTTGTFYTFNTQIQNLFIITPVGYTVTKHTYNLDGKFVSSKGYRDAVEPRNAEIDSEHKYRFSARRTDGVSIEENFNDFIIFESTMPSLDSIIGRLNVLESTLLSAETLSSDENE